MNVWTPKDASDLKLYPVFVWFHGADFTFGSSDPPHFRYNYLTAYTKIVTVTLNFRLGATGYAYGAMDQIVGNEAVHDIIVASDFVRTNIRAFGGDPDRVTLSGLSSGSIMLSAMFMTPTVPTYWFNRIVFMSGLAIEQINSISAEKAFKLTKHLSKDLNCSEYETSNDSFNTDETICLKVVPGKLIAKAPENYMYMILYGDKYILPVQPRDLINSRQFPKGFKIMIGTETDEAYFGRNIKPKTVSKAILQLSSFVQKLGITSNEGAMDLARRYFAGVNEFDVPQIRKRVISFLSNLYFQCPSLLYSIAFAEDGANTVYSYRNNYVTAYTRAKGRPFGARHADDQDLFTGEPFRHRDRYDEHDREASLFMMNVLGDFVKGQDPFWSPVNVTGHQPDQISLPRIHIANNVTFTNVDQDTDKDICLVWAKYLKLNV